TISGLTITNGRAALRGGGIYNDHSTLVVSKCMIVGNAADFAGGIANDGSLGGSATLAVIHSTVAENWANGGVGAGSGLENYGSSGIAALEVVNCTITRNHGHSALDSYGGLGGSATLRIANTTVNGDSVYLVQNTGLFGSANVEV